MTGAKLAQVDLEEFLTWKDNEDTELAALFEKHRGNAKPANFGLLYGMRREGFMAYAWANYGIKLTLEEAEKMRNAFFQLYPGLLDFHERQRDLVRIHGRSARRWAASAICRRSRAGTARSKSKAERQAINSPDPVLPGRHDGLGDRADRRTSSRTARSRSSAMIHDALVAYVDEDKVQASCRQVVQLMSNLPLHELGWKPQLKFTVDAEAGPNLADMKKLKLAA